MTICLIKPIFATNIEFDLHFMEQNFQIDSKGSAVPPVSTSSKTFKELGAKFKNLSLQAAVSFNNLATHLMHKGSFLYLLCDSTYEYKPSSR